MVGELLGSYRITSELSSGAMGTVYRAQHELLGRPAAVKVLRPELTEHANLVQRFFNEAKAATAIRHPGIVEVYDFGYTQTGRAYLVMEFLDGEPLANRLRSRGRLSEPEVANIGKGIASALKAAHGQGIVHRDLKPDNVFLVPDPDGSSDRIKVLDFGVAKLADAASSGANRTMTGFLMGTPLYMAPEQARAAGTIDHRADLYSLGCMVYELLVGEPPFVATGAGEVIAMQMFMPPQPPSRRLVVSPDLDAIVMRLLAKQPHERYQSAAEVFDAFAAVGKRLSRQRSAQIAVTSAAEASSSVPVVRDAQPQLQQVPQRSVVLPVIASVIAALALATVVIFAIYNAATEEPPPITGPGSAAVTATPAAAPAPSDSRTAP